MKWPNLCTSFVLHALAEADSSQLYDVTNTSLYTWNQSNWTLTTHVLYPGQYQSRMSLSNGYIGASVASIGPFCEADTFEPNENITNGWPLFNPRISFSTVSGFYNIQPNTTRTNYEWLNQYGWESVIAGIPHATAVVFNCDGKTLDASVSIADISDFTSSFSFKTGVATWNFTWTPDTTAYAVSFTAFVSRKRSNLLAVEATITAQKQTSCKVIDFLDGRSAVRSYSAGKGSTKDGSNDTIWTAVHPDGLRNVTAYIYSKLEFSGGARTLVEDTTGTTSIGQQFDICLQGGQQKVFHKFVGIASTDKFKGAEKVAFETCVQASLDGWLSLLTEHVHAWSAIMTENTVDNYTDPLTGRLPEGEYIQVLQIASVANTFYLLQNLEPEGSGLDDNSIPVGGLTSDSYGGMVFWDADYWMAPGLTIGQPRFATQIGNFRVKQFDQAQRNADFNGYPTGAALYPWTAGRYGNCTGTGPCVDYEYHINPDIAFSLAQTYDVTNNRTWFDDGPRQIIYATALAASHVLKWNGTSKSYWIRNMTDPDEYANNVDNGAFTISSFAVLLNLANRYRIEEGLSSNETWQYIANHIEFPRAQAGITLEYETMNGNVEVKQVDVGLLAYPLQYEGNNYTREQMIQDVEYYAEKQSPEGPAMTWSVYAINALTLDTSGCASYTYTMEATIPYLRAPWFQFSEQADDDYESNGGTNPAFPFLTGHGGAHQIAPFGFLGLRTGKTNGYLYVDPSLPPQVPHLKLRNIYFAGTRLEAVMNQTHTTIQRHATSIEEGVIDKYANTTLPIYQRSTSILYSLAINETLTIPNRRPHLNQSNLVQCRSLNSSTRANEVVDGQLPLSAIDGSNATKWQPMLDDTISSIWIDTRINDVYPTPPNIAPLSRISINWADRPALHARVMIGNGTFSNTILGQAFENDDVNLTAMSEISDAMNYTIIRLASIIPSELYNETLSAEEVLDIRPHSYNTTVVDIGEFEVWRGEWVVLEIEGCFVDDGIGASVAEFAIF